MPPRLPGVDRGDLGFRSDRDDAPLVDGDRSAFDHRPRVVDGHHDIAAHDEIDPLRGAPVAVVVLMRFHEGIADFPPGRGRTCPR
ncbi:MAG TPA: hypothetical protein VFX74_02555 [Candidatus Limnocylindria bacterium]|nr:hypothetical protein [Candidatus Limnocylindria bacterium]